MSCASSSLSSRPEPSLSNLSNRCWMRRFCPFSWDWSRVNIRLKGSVCVTCRNAGEPRAGERER
eukprot:6291108-Pyramimonas_sp.AAC.2